MENGEDRNTKRAGGTVHGHKATNGTCVARVSRNQEKTESGEGRAEERGGERGDDYVQATRNDDGRSTDSRTNVDGMVGTPSIWEREGWGLHDDAGSIRNETLANDQEQSNTQQCVT